MSEAISAVVEDGVFRPDQPTWLPDGTRVRLIIQPITKTDEKFAEKFARLVALRKQSPIQGGGRVRREELYDPN